MVNDMSAERTIAQNLELLASTKASIMSAINAKGGDITSSTPFSAYSAAIAALDVNVYSLEVLDLSNNDEPEELQNGTYYEARLMNNGNQVNEYMGGFWSFEYMPNDYDGTDYSQNINQSDDQSGQVDNSFYFNDLPDGELIIIYYDSSYTELASITLPVIGEAQGGQYRIEIYDDMAMDYGSQVQPEQLGTGNNYYVYLYDTVNNEYKEDALDWDLTTDDDGTLIYSIEDGDSGGFSHCKQMFTNLSDGGTTTLYAVEAFDQDNVLASIEIRITAP